MSIVPHEQLIAGDLDHDLSSRQLVSARVSGEDFRSHLEAACQMSTVTLILAHVLEYFRVSDVGLYHAQSERLRKSLGIVKCHFQLQMSEIRAPIPFRESEGFGLGVAAYVEPALVIEADRIDDQSIPFPMPDRISQPGWFGIFGQLSAIHEDCPMGAVG